MPIPNRKQQPNNEEEDAPTRSTVQSTSTGCLEWPEQAHQFDLIMQQLHNAHQQQNTLMVEHIEQSSKQLNELVAQQRTFFNEFEATRIVRRGSRRPTFDPGDDSAVGRPRATPSTSVQWNYQSRTSRQRSRIDSADSPHKPEWNYQSRTSRNRSRIDSADSPHKPEWNYQSRTSRQRGSKLESADEGDKSTDKPEEQSLGAMVKRARFTIAPSKAATQDLDTIVHMSSLERKKRSARRHAKAVQVEQDDDDDEVLTSDGRGLRCLQRLNSLRLSLQVVVAGWAFEGLCGVLVMANAVFVGLQVEHGVTNPSTEEPYGFRVLSGFFAIAFAIELFLKLLAYGYVFFVDEKQRTWNWIDTVVVVCSLAELFAKDATQFKNFGVIRTARILKVMRLARMVKVFKFSHDLRVLLIAIGCSLRFLLWAMMLLSTIIYMFGVLFSQATADYLADGGGDILCVQFFEFYGNLPRTCRTLFESVSGGVSWHEPLMCIRVFGWQWELCFILYISFAFLAVLNVVTGVFCNSAIEAAQLDQDMVVQLHRAEKETKVKRFKELFNRMDEDGSGTVTLAEFEHHLEDSEFASFLSQMDLAPEDAWDIFRLLDTESRYEVNIDEFVEGCLSLRGNANKFDIKIMMIENKTMTDKVRRLLGLVEACLMEKEDILGLDVQQSLLRTYVSDREVMSSRE